VISRVQSGQGGAVFSTTGALDIQPAYVGAYFHNCTFRLNRATGEGGALYISGQRLDLLSSQFSENYVSTVNTYFTDSPSQVRTEWSDCVLCVL
jgi:predicted outer membrane repeat protein